MVRFIKEELLDAQKALMSSVHKIERVQETLSKRQPPPKSQLTLAGRNLKALRLSLALIEIELEKFK